MVPLNRHGAVVMAASCVLLSACSSEVLDEGVADSGEALTAATADGRAALAPAPSRGSPFTPRT